ncbi:PREDICTED: LOW QUALITY PROTEIN: pecanex-like protein 4 [Priapulus caudatus]|uniref:Pecanex-like protein n=1 Tax=Priapulus caudatus TaxID=37621 RepID=A0ABM1ED35_PRICU|nr:PREDICTED: LOW QUALITY PROTEIN: pecanex-like protein 4 [Priapulus caudatus]
MHLQVLNPYKREFFWKRFPQTLLGGVRLNVGYRVPWYVYFVQVALFFTPALIGGACTAAAECGAARWHVAAAVCGGAVAIYSVALQVYARVVRRRIVTPLRVAKSNLLADEDEVSFASPWAPETARFVIAAKAHWASVVAHGALAGAAAALTMLFLLPSRLSGLYASTGATVVLLTLGWLTLCVALYALVVSRPPEPAVYAAADRLEIACTLRVVYVLCVVVVDAAMCFQPGIEHMTSASHWTLSSALHIAFPFLPLLWAVGMLPPPDALFLWLLEQTVVLLLGGSPMATDLRLIVTFVLSVGSVVIVCYMPSVLASLLVGACLGYLLSLDLFCLRLRRNTAADSTSGFMWKFGPKEAGFHLVMLGLTATAAWFGSAPPGTAINKDYRFHAVVTFIGFLIKALLVISHILDNSQQVYVAFALFRNCMFPSILASETAFLRRKRYLGFIGYARRLIISGVGPLLMVFYIAALSSAAPLPPPQPSLPALLYALGVARSLRNVWQNTHQAMLEFCRLHVIALIAELAPSLLTLSHALASWTDLYDGVKLLCIGVVIHRVSQLALKLYLYFVLLGHACADRKTRVAAILPVVVGNAVFFPVVLAVVAATVVLSAPLLPVFTLPAFIVGFPRPLKFWPDAAGSSFNRNEDTVYYQQLVAPLAAAMSNAIANGSVGDAGPGSHYLARFQDRLVWMHVLERGYGYRILSIKGLQLEKTSCQCFLIYMLVGQCFVQSLLWVLLHHITIGQYKDIPDIDGADVKNAKTDATTDPDDSPKHPRPPSSPRAASAICVERSQSSRSFPNSVWSDDDTFHDEAATKPHAAVATNYGGAPDSADTTVALLRELRGLGSDDVDVRHSRHDVLNSAPFGSAMQVAPPSGAPAGGRVTDAEPAFAHPHATPPRWTDGVGGFGLPARDAETPKTDAKHHLDALEMTLFSASKLPPAMPARWRQMPVRAGDCAGVAPTAGWYEHVVDSLHTSGASTETVAALQRDADAREIYSHVALSCYAVVNRLGTAGASLAELGASHVHKCFRGDVPWSPALDWVRQDEVLFALIIKAYRYAVKLMYIQGSLGPLDDMAELEHYLHEFDCDTYIGQETSAEWADAISAGKKHLFSLGYNNLENVYTGRVLTRQPTAVKVGQLNSEAVRGLWASLSLELLYFTNDDEERYSIQALPLLLRNLTVQSAAPPLGYPVYSSPPLHVPAL